MTRRSRIAPIPLHRGGPQSCATPGIRASLIYVNAWDHLITLVRILGGDGAMPLFSQASVSRVVCEAAVRFAWLMDLDISSAQRLVRAAVALHVSAEERSKGVRALPAERFDPRISADA